MKYWIKFRHWLIKQVVGDYPVVMNVHLEPATNDCGLRLLPGLVNGYVANCNFECIAIGPAGYKQPDLNIAELVENYYNVQRVMRVS